MPGLKSPQKTEEFLRKNIAIINDQIAGLNQQREQIDRQLAALNATRLEILDQLCEPERCPE